MRNADKPNAKSKALKDKIEPMKHHKGNMIRAVKNLESLREKKTKDRL